MKIQKRNLVILMVAVTVMLLQACGIKKDPELLKIIEAIPVNCEMHPPASNASQTISKSNYGWKIENCKNNENKMGQEYIKKVGVSKALPTLVATFDSDDEKISAASTYFLNWNVGSSFELKNIAKNPELVEDKVIDTFIKAFKKRMNENYAQYATRALVNIGSIKKRTEALWDIYNSADEKAPFKGGFIASIMQYGGMDSFSQIQKVAGSDNVYQAASAIRAPMSHYEIAGEELKTVCSWWSSLLGNEKIEISAAASAGLTSKCEAEQIDAALAEIEKRIAVDAQNSKKYSWALSNVRCPSQRYSEEQCAKSTALKEKDKK